MATPHLLRDNRRFTGRSQDWSEEVCVCGGGGGGGAVPCGPIRHINFHVLLYWQGGGTKAAIV